MKYVLEQAKASDVPAILAVMERFNMHRVPSPEMEALEPECFSVARLDGRLVGAAGYKVLSPGLGKSTLLAVLPEYAGFGIGKALQSRRMELLYEQGVRRLVTNADRPDTILWYKKHFGYREVGTLEKLVPFGLETVSHWTTLETDLGEYFATVESRSAAREAYIRRNDAHPLAPFPPLIVNACLTGIVPTRVQSPHVPLSPEEIVEDVLAVAAAGASVVHLHARDAEGQPSSDPRLYEHILSGIRREHPSLICTVTTSGRGARSFEERTAVLELTGAARPDMASLTTGSLNFLTGASPNSIETVERLAMAMKERGIKPELEVFDLGMINLVKYLERNGLVSGTKYVNILLGNLNSAPADIGSLSALLHALPGDSVWSVAGLGQFQLPMNCLALAGGGHVRVGIEDAIYYDYARERPARNRELVERLARIAAELQRPLATPEEARRMLGLPQRTA
jgi:uncharacterized protein (DUF849 family)/N-acetylglutamate synthase-like GNAT family acetyltransferase